MTSVNIFARPINYNEGSYKQDLLQSMRPGQYLLDPNYANRKMPRRVEDIGFVGTQGASLARNKSLIDIDSKMRMPYNATRDPSQMQQQVFEKRAENNIDFCPTKMNIDYTRYSNPNILAPVHNKNRFEPLYLNPQEASRWKTPFLIGFQSRWDQR